MTPEQTVQLRTMAVDLAVRSFQPGDILLVKAQDIHNFIMADVNAQQEAKQAAVASKIVSIVPGKDNSLV